MGKAFSSLVRRPMKNWNIENRAQSFLDKQSKPSAAPRHPSTQEALEQFTRENPEAREAQTKKDENFSTMLRGMVVNPQRMGEIVPKKDHLPKDRAMVADEEYGYLEPNVIRPGRCSIRQALTFIGDYYTDSSQHSAASIAKEYKLDEERVKNVLKYFNVFNVQIPQKDPTKDRMSVIAEAAALKPNFFQRGSLPEGSSTDGPGNSSDKK